MSDYKPYREMTDDEIVRTFRQIANRFERDNDPVASFKVYIAEHFDLDTPPAITYSEPHYSEPNGAGQRMCMRMFMGMTFSPTTSDDFGEREIISF